MGTMKVVKEDGKGRAGCTSTPRRQWMNSGEVLLEEIMAEDFSEVIK